MIILKDPVSIQEIKVNHSNFYSTMVKIVVDLERELVALDAEMHADLEEHLLELESEQRNLWGANIYFERPGFIEFTSLINIRPAQNNRSMEVEDRKVRDRISEIVNKFIIW